jgi:hypothetical protein
MGAEKGVTAGHRDANGGGGRGNGAQTTGVMGPKYEYFQDSNWGTQRPLLVVSCYPPFLFNFFSFIFFSASTPRHFNHNICTTLAHIISNTSSSEPFFFFLLFTPPVEVFRVSNMRAA